MTYRKDDKIHGIIPLIVPMKYVKVYARSTGMIKEFYKKQDLTIERKRGLIYSCGSYKTVLRTSKIRKEENN